MTVACSCMHCGVSCTFTDVVWCNVCCFVSQVRWCSSPLQRTLETLFSSNRTHRSNPCVRSHTTPHYRLYHCSTLLYTTVNHSTPHPHSHYLHVCLCMHVPTQEVTFRWYADRSMPQLLVWYIVGQWISQWKQDINIWENKKFAPKPVLVCVCVHVYAYMCWCAALWLLFLL